MALDPADECTFWDTQEHYAVTSAVGWQTRVGAECALGSLDPGGRATVTIVATVTAASSISNIATASASQSDPSPADNSATATGTVLAAKPDLVVATVSKPPVAAAPGHTFAVTSRRRPRARSHRNQPAWH